MERWQGSQAFAWLTTKGKFSERNSEKHVCVAHLGYCLGFLSWQRPKPLALWVVSCSDEAKLKREVVNEVARLIPSNEAVDVEEFRVGLEGPANMCIQMLENMDPGPGMLGWVGLGRLLLQGNSTTILRLRRGLST